MSPLRGEEFTGRSVEEAIERGLRSLGKKRTDVEYEVLEKGKPANVLGMGGEDARVLITFVEEEAPPEPEPVIDEAEVPRRPDAIREREERREEREDAEREEAAPALAEDLAAGAEVLRDLLALMGVEAEVALDNGPLHEGIDVLGADLGALIGRGGENLVALQQITSAITSRRVGRTVHVPLDIEGYRRRREEQLREIDPEWPPRGPFGGAARGASVRLLAWMATGRPHAFAVISGSTHLARSAVAFTSRSSSRSCRLWSVGSAGPRPTSRS